ncbi:OmpA family protein [candidate division WOR-3 bacterium]|nr:OmpA family protein [candidate division WOR-3 bacterium]
MWVYTKCTILVLMLTLSGYVKAARDEITSRDYKIFIKLNAPSEDAFVAVQRLAEPYIQVKQWDIALEVFEKYQPLFPRMDARFRKIIEILKTPEEDLIITNLGPSINTPGYEGFPAPSADGRYLFFTGKLRSDCLGEEDVFVAEMIGGEWTQAQNMGETINTTEGNESVTSVSFDGNQLMLLGSFEESRGGGDIFYIERTSQGWGEIKHFPWPINSINFDSDALLTSDGKAILFTSDRRGVIGNFHEKGLPFHGNFWGNTDIFICERLDTGWSQPVNLGQVINTPYAERTPFLHPDGKTLYFSSEGHYGLGRLDVFKSVRLSDTSWTEWSEPVNLGKCINTMEDDLGYKVATTGDFAFFSAYREGDDKADDRDLTIVPNFGGYDIYSVTLPEKAKPEVVATITGRVTDEAGEPLDAEIKWENLVTGQTTGQLRSNPQDGSYIIVLPLGRHYGYFAEKEGYYPVSKNIDLTNETQVVEILENIVLVSLKKDTVVRINNIFFAFDEYTLRPESYPELNRLAEILKEYPDIRVEIAGHTDNQGTDEYNLELSGRRAQSVVDYLIQAGYNQANLIPKGYGESKPIDTNETDEGRAKNRRVEFRFIKR